MKEFLNKKKFSVKNYLKFILPSIIGILLFMFPLKYHGDTTIVVALFAEKLTGVLGNALPTILLVLLTFTGIMTLIYQLFKPSAFEENKFLKGQFDIGKFWKVVRVVGMVLGFLTYFKIVPEWIWYDATDFLILKDLMLGLFSIFLFDGFLLSLLTNFGLLEFVGALLTPVMSPVFTLPGRSSIDCISSWVGDGT